MTAAPILVKTLIDLLVVAAIALALLLLSSCREDDNARDKLDTTPSEASKRLDADDMDSPRQVVESYEKARNAGDVVRVTGLVIERIANQGEAAIKKGWNEVRATRFELETIERGDDENKAWAIGRYTVEREDGTVETYDRWVFPLYKEDGKWKIDPDGAEAATQRWQEKKDTSDQSKD